MFRGYDNEGENCFERVRDDEGWRNLLLELRLSDERNLWKYQQQSLMIFLHPWFNNRCN
jgi:hypothetical protein